jgi:hypothetical protein
MLHLGLGFPTAPCRLAVATYVAQRLDSVPAEPLDSLLQLACSMFNVSAALLVLCGDRCVRIVRAHCTQGEFKVSLQLQSVATVAAA